MNSFASYITRLLPSFHKSSIVSSAQATRESIQKNTLPVISTAADLQKTTPLKSSFAKTVESEVSKLIGKKPLFINIENILGKAIKLLEICENYADKAFSDTETNRAMTYPKATVIKMVEAGEFVNTYTRKLTNLIVTLEVIEAGGDTAKPPPNDEKWLLENLTDYAMSLRLFDTDIETFEKRLKSIPDSIISDMSEKSLTVTKGTSNIDPFFIRNLSAKVNPFYLIRMYKAEWDASRYESAENDKRLLEFRLLQLKRMKEKTPNDARLDLQIQHMQDRVNKINKQIEEYNKDWNISGGN